MGGYCQALGHANLISKVLDYGMDLQEAIDLPRVMPASDGIRAEAEHTPAGSTRAELERRGFAFSPTQDPIGGAQAIRIDWENGTLIGASDPRKDGIALGV